MRSYLFVPGDRKDRFRSAVDSGADAIILDLEDAVAPSEKDDARKSVGTFLAHRDTPLDVEVWVRVNADSLGDDLAALGASPPDGIVVAKAEVEVLQQLDLAWATECGHVPEVRTIPLVETAKALGQLDHLAMMPRVERLMIGEVDLAAELGIVPSDDARELLPLRSLLVVASTTAGIRPPVGSVWPQLSDLAGLRQSAVDYLRQGFRGALAIHPSQVPAINEVFTPNQEEVAGAREVVELYEAALRKGSGVILDDSGAMIDLAVVRRARDVLARCRL